MSGTKPLDMLQRQIGWLGIYVNEWQQLEQLDMPSEWRERALRIRRETAPLFFALVASLLRDAVIQVLANILDKPTTGGKPNLTLESEIASQSRPDLVQRLEAIRTSATYADIKSARNKLLSHSDFDAVVNFDTLALPNLTLRNLAALVEEVTNIVAELSGEPASNFMHPSWEGAELLFDLLDRKK
jgi:hypothetical protein